MRDKILAELRKKFPGLSTQLLGLLADKLATKVTEDSQIEGAVTELDKLPITISDYAKLLQQEGDRRVTEAEKKWKDKNPKKEDSDEDDDDEDEPAESKKDKKRSTDTKMAKQVAELANQLKALQEKDSKAGLSQKLEDKLKEKKIPLQFAKGKLPDKEEDLDNLVNDIEKDYQEVKQQLVNDGVINNTVPVGGSSITTKTDSVEKDITDWATKKQPVKQEAKT